MFRCSYGHHAYFIKTWKMVTLPLNVYYFPHVGLNPWWYEWSLKTTLLSWHLSSISQWAGSDSIDCRTCEAVVIVDWYNKASTLHGFSLHCICEVVDNYSLHLLFYPTVTMHKGKNSVLISNADILICWKLRESLICLFDQNRNWFNCELLSMFF